MPLNGPFNASPVSAPSSPNRRKGAPYPALQPFQPLRDGPELPHSYGSDGVTPASRSRSGSAAALAAVHSAEAARSAAAAAAHSAEAARLAVAAVMQNEDAGRMEEGNPAQPLLAVPSSPFKLHRAWYVLYGVPVIALGLQAFLALHTLRNAKKAPLNWFSSDNASAVVAGFSELGPILFALRTLHRFFLQVQLDPETTKKQLHPVKPLFLTLAGLVSMMYMVETILDTGFLLEATDAFPPLMYGLAAITVLSAVITNTINLYMRSKKDDCPRMANYQALIHKRQLASEDEEVARSLNQILKGDTLPQDKISLILLQQNPSVVDLGAAAEKKWSFENSYVVWVIFFGFAFFQYGPPGPKAWHCLSNNLDSAACSKTITLDAYLRPQDFGYGAGALMGVVSTAANSYIWRKTASQVKDAWDHADGISRGLALVFLGFSMVLTYAQVTANEPLKSSAGDQVIGIILPLLSGGLSFISYMGVFNTDAFKGFTRQIRVGCGVVEAPSAEQSQAMQGMNTLLEEAESNPSILAPAV